MTVNIEKAVRYFRSNVPFVRDKAARLEYATQLADAETWAIARRAVFAWTIDEEIQFADAAPAWRCSLYLNGKPVAVGCPENFLDGTPWADKYGYRRVAETILALDYLNDGDREPATVSIPVQSAMRPMLELCAA